MAECAPMDVSTPPAVSTTDSCPSSSADRKLKCRKCRQLLLQQPPHQLVLDEGVEGVVEAAAVYSLQEEEMPDWINTAIEQANKLLFRIAVDPDRHGSIFIFPSGY